MALIIVIIVLIIGLNILASGIKGLIKSQKSKSWPQINVTITKSEVREDPPIKHNGLPTFHPDIEFVFTYHDKEYTCKPTRFSKIENPREHLVEEYLKGFPVGSVTKAYISPLNPEESELECGANQDDTFTIGIGILVIAFSLVGYIKYVL